MLRWLFHIFAALSLVLMIASCVAWVRSLHREEGFAYFGTDAHYTVGYSRGRFGLEWQPGALPHYSGGHVYSLDSSPGFEDYTYAQPRVQFVGFEYIVLGTIVLVRIPIFAVSVLLAIVPTLWILRHRRKRTRGKRSLCITCGYDMRGSSGTCPECGATAASNA